MKTAMRGGPLMQGLLSGLMVVTGWSVVSFGAGVPTARVTDDADFGRARARMVQEQIRARGITDSKVLEALLRVERHRFVPPESRVHAYDDGPLPIGQGQTISQPYIVAFMTDVLDLSRRDRVLEIGTGSGYQAAVLAELAGSVYSIEINETLGRRAARLLRELDYDTVHVRIGDGFEGWPEEAPFDAVIVTCAPSSVPEPLVRQLREGGRMIIPVGGSYAQELVVLRKVGGGLERKAVLPVLFVPMVDRKGRTY